MDNHPFSYDDLLDYLAGHLDAERKIELAEHLRTCQDCAATIAEFNAIRNLLRSDTTPEPPPRAVARAQAIFQSRRPLHRPQPFRLRLPSPVFSFSAGFALALVLLFSIGLFVANQDVPPDSALYPIKAAVQGLRSVTTVRKPSSNVQTSPTPTTKTLVNPTAVQSSSAGASPTRSNSTAAPSASTGNVVISQIYGGGGNAGAPFTNDFIELFNRGTTPVALAGWSIQYASAAGTGNFGAGATQITELPDFMLEPGQYFLVQEARGSGGGAALPTPDLIDATPIALSASGGKVVLARTNVSLNCNGGTAPCSASTQALIIDLIGYGRVDSYEGVGPAPESSNTTAIVRIIEGCQDTNSNLDDCILSAPSPRNSASPRYQCPPATKP